MNKDTYNLQATLLIKKSGFPFFLGCLKTLREMFPGETEEDLVLILTKNNFDLEKSANDILCSNAGASKCILIAYFV